MWRAGGWVGAGAGSDWLGLGWAGGWQGGLCLALAGGLTCLALKRKLVLIENGKVASRPKKKVSEWPTATSNFIFLRFRV